MGEVPEWYPLIVAAKWLGVPPWELAQAPRAYEEWALIARAAEADAEEQRARRNQQAG